ncbi:MAG: hypothetical protein EKK40_18925 [Bradyrhizobiaceae bacterium]|nr:MAG: hypothetical protein EKK40_18925 [Bradyrhizobiaceae bacterium]
MASSQLFSLFWAWKGFLLSQCVRPAARKGNFIVSTKKANRTKKGFGAADLKAVSDNPEWTEKDFARVKPFSEVFPDLAKTIRGRGPQKAPTKEPVSIRLSQDVLKYYRSQGPGWQTKVDETLRKAAKLNVAKR